MASIHPENPTQEQTNMSAQMDDDERSLIGDKNYDPKSGQQNPYQNCKPTRHGLSETRLYWVTPTIAIICFLFAIAFAIGNHVYFSSLDSQEPNNQKWQLRYSIILAFLVKMFVGTTIGIALCQQVWYTVERHRAGFSIGALDALFSLDTSVISLFKMEVWRYAFSAISMTLCIWLLPLITIVAPTALTFRFNSYTTLDSQCSVPHISFTSQGEGLNFWIPGAHSTVVSGGPSSMARQSVELPARTGLRNTWESPCGGNCSYETSFVAPSWDCTDVNFTDKRIPWIRDSVNPKDPFIPFWGTNLSQAGMTNHGQYGTSMATYRTYYTSLVDNSTGRLWAGFAHVLESPAPSVTTLYCDLVNSSYDLKIKYTNGQQQIQISNVTALNPIWLYHNSTSEDYFTGVDAVWQSRGLALPVTELLVGDAIMEYTGNSGTGVSTSITMLPGLVNTSTIEPALIDQFSILPNISKRIEEMSHNISISLMSNPKLEVYETKNTTCERYSVVLQWRYEPWILWLTYGIAILLALICLVLASVNVIFSTTAVRSKAFSTIMRTTRDPRLNDLLEGEEHGAQPLKKKLDKARLRFRTQGREREKVAGFEPVDGLLDSTD